jgi:hypothetical protein
LVIIKTISELKKGEAFEFVEPSYPKGALRVFSGWGVRFRDKPYTEPWFLSCYDEEGKNYCLTLPTTTQVRLL